MKRLAELAWDVLPGLLLILVGFLAAWSWQGARGAAELAALKADYAQRSADVAEEAARQLAAKQEHIDRIVRASSQRETALDTQLQETRHALKTATRGHPCLGGAALRVLDSAPGLRPPAGTAPAGVSDRGLAAATADSEDSEAEAGDVATDTDVAEWIATAGRYYERCRGRLADIRAAEGGP